MGLYGIAEGKVAWDIMGVRSCARQLCAWNLWASSRLEIGLKRKERGTKNRGTKTRMHTQREKDGKRVASYKT